MGERVCAIHQPNFFPRLATLAKLMAADIWVVLDDVQFTRRDYQHRCRLAALHDATIQQWLTLPVHLQDGRATRITNVRLAEPAASQRRTYRQIQHYYSRSPHWPTISEPLRDVLDAFDRTHHLSEIAEVSTQVLLRLLNWPGTIVRSSTLPTRTGRSERLADLTHTVGADIYLCGTGGARYLIPEPFTAYGIHIERFAAPHVGSPAIWTGARRISALWALMATGPKTLAETLDEHSRLILTTRGARNDASVPGARTAQPSGIGSHRGSCTDPACSPSPKPPRSCWPGETSRSARN